MTATAFIDGTAGVRTESVRWDVHDADMNLVGQLAVDRTQAATMENDGTAAIRRRISNLIIEPRRFDQSQTMLFAEDVDTLTMRVRPWWIIETATGPVEYPLGIFVFGDDSQLEYTWGEPRHCALTDLTTDLDQSLDKTVGYAAGHNIGFALIEQADLEGFGAGQRNIEATSRTVEAPVGWVTGRDTRLNVFDSLCAVAGFLPVYFDNNGLLTCRAAPDLTTATPTFVYGLNTVVEYGSVLKSNDKLTAPNRYVVIDSSSDVELVGIFDIPDDAPHSFANTGRLKRTTRDVQGLQDQAAADAAAAAAYASDSAGYAWLQFTTPPDPRHDTWDILSFNDVNFRQIGWTLEMKAGGAMVHDCRGTYS